jgi:hypothetical protein
MEGIVTGIIVNIILMFVIKFGAMLAELHCSWGIAFIIAALITWVGVVVISISDGDIDIW